MKLLRNFLLDKISNHQINRFKWVTKATHLNLFITYFGIISICFFTHTNLNAQDTISDNIITEQIWLDYNHEYSLSEGIDLYGELGARTVLPNEWYRYVVGASVRFKRPKLFFSKLYYKEELHSGIKFYFTANKNFSNRIEIRPFQGYKLYWPNRPRVVIQHYVRLEERFDVETANWINTFGLRLRYRAKMTLKFKGDLVSFNDGLYLPIRMELFWNLKGAQQFNDVVRITPGIGYEFSSTWKGELNIGYFYTRNTVEDVFGTNDLVLRIRVFHNLSRE